MRGWSELNSVTMELGLLDGDHDFIEHRRDWITPIVAEKLGFKSQSEATTPEIEWETSDQSKDIICPKKPSSKARAIYSLGGWETDERS